MLGRHSLRPYPETRFASKDRKRAVPFHATQDCLGCVGCRRQCEHLADEGVVGTNKRSGQNGGTSAKVPLKFRCEGPEKAIDNLDDSGSFGIRSTTGRAEQAAGMLEAAQHAHQCLGGKQGVVPAQATILHDAGDESSEPAYGLSGPFVKKRLAQSRKTWHFGA